MNRESPVSFFFDTNMEFLPNCLRKKFTDDWLFINTAQTPFCSSLETEKTNKKVYTLDVKTYWKKGRMSPNWFGNVWLKDISTKVHKSAANRVHFQFISDLISKKRLQILCILCSSPTYNPTINRAFCLCVAWASLPRNQLWLFPTDFCELLSERGHELYKHGKTTKQLLLDYSSGKFASTTTENQEPSVETD